MSYHKRRKKQRREQLEDANPKMKKIKSSKKMNRHHLINKCNGGTMSIHNILWIYINRHHVWHELFHNLDLNQVIELLIRVKSAKENQTESHPR